MFAISCKLDRLGAHLVNYTDKVAYHKKASKVTFHMKASKVLGAPLLHLLTLPLH